ncbi:MAG: ATP-binding protein [Thioploca sp.]|nr:ATP-binding protein [Thioploca sp.]
MSRIKVKNFGPIKVGFEENDGFLEIKKITVFIGNQGTGKSSVAKLISTMNWLEKAFYQGKLTEKEVSKYNRFVNNYCTYHGLKNYFLPETEIEYQGTVYNFKFNQGKLNVQSHFTSSEEYIVPKIMYVPAERNFLSTVKIKNLQKLKELPQSLFTFWEELERSQEELSGSLTLPVGNAKFEFDRLNKTSNIVGESYKLMLSEASSGFHSFVPLFLVSHNLAHSIDKERDASKTELSGEEQKRLRAEIEKILSDDTLSEEVKKTALKILSSKYRNQRFLNIVEEIEQNLFPSSQQQLLYQLLKFTNYTTENGLILTTHSPYIINYLTLAIQGASLLQKINVSDKSEDLKKRLNEIVPVDSCVAAEDTVVYELTETGKINKLATYEGLPTDDNFLNRSLAESNLLFDGLLEIEEELCL